MLLWFRPADDTRAFTPCRGYGGSLTEAEMLIILRWQILELQPSL